MRGILGYVIVELILLRFWLVDLGMGWVERWSGVESEWVVVVGL